MVSDDKPKSAKLHEQYDDLSTFEETLDDAELNASSDFAEGFVADMRAKYTQYGKDMYLSGKQRTKLEEIAAGENNGPR